ncbi:MAG: hypothetical protein OXM02_03510 [Bacteroidota bacterium]|nr:hypothetical protein [Bacteroidota bacterium]MDE2833568.1 hypothetical protein [Bacteroidota bacterium]MDE2955527.1 hypothetical protein [Bacteroidota bacterium]
MKAITNTNSAKSSGFFMTARPDADCRGFVVLLKFNMILMVISVILKTQQKRFK